MKLTRTAAQAVLDKYGIKLGTMGFSTPTGGETFVRGFILNQARAVETAGQGGTSLFHGRVIHQMADTWASTRSLLRA